MKFSKWALGAALLVVLFFLSTPLVGPVLAGQCGETPAAPSLGATTNNPITMSYTYTAKSKYNFEYQMEMKMSLNGMGQQMEINVPMKFFGDYNIISVDKEGNAEIDMKISRITMKMDGPMPMEFDSAKGAENIDPAMKPLMAMVNTPMKAKVSSKGKTLEIDIEPLKKALGADGEMVLTELKKTTDELMRGSFVALPDQPVKAGDTYDGGSYSQSMGGMGEMKAQITYKVLAVSADKTRVLLEPTITFDTQMAAGVPGLKMSNDGQQGWMLINLATGEAKSAMNMCLSMSVEQGDQKMETKMIMKIAYTADQKK